MCVSLFTELLTDMEQIRFNKAYQQIINQMEQTKNVFPNNLYINLTLNTQSW